MNFEEFCNYLLEHIREYLPEELRTASVERIDKAMINGGVSVGIAIHEQDKNLAPCFYVNEVFEQYKEGATIEELCERLVDGYMEARNIEIPTTSSDIFNYDTVKDQILPRVINFKRNREMLEERPYSRINDLAVIYMVDLPNFNGYGASVPIFNSIFEKWRIPLSELHSTAIQNAVTNNAYVLHDIRAMIVGDLSMNYLESDVSSHAAADVPMLVLTTESQLDGAAALANPDILMSVANAVQGDYYILPSSIDELLIISKESAQENGSTPKQLGEMVRQVNQQEVEQTSQLSDHIYEFNMENRELRSVPESMKKTREAER